MAAASKVLAVLNRGLPGNNVADGTMMLSLARSTRIQAYGYGGGYEPGMSSDSGYELGKELTSEYALVPHPGDWRQAGVYRDGLEFNHPLLAQTVTSHPGATSQTLGPRGNHSPKRHHDRVQARSGRHGRAAVFRSHGHTDARLGSALGHGRRGGRSESHGGRRDRRFRWPTTSCNVTCALSRSRRSNCG